jgi:hypothetical protein
VTKARFHTAMVAAFVLAASMHAAPASSQATSPVPGAPPNPSSLAAPAAPAPVAMECVPGQVDVNNPSAETFASLLTPDGSPLSAPVRARILEGQPYLQPSDLLAVPGVTRNHIALWSSRKLACATPKTLPPPAPDICEKDQADVNDPRDRPRFAALYGRPTSDRLIEGIPYPSVVNALRIAGVGPGRIMQTADLVCATPYPIRHAGVDWAFATSDEGIAVDTHGDYGAYTLTVPAGVTGGLGSWASISEVNSTLADAVGIDYFDLDTPSADAHIHGPWLGHVGLTLPKDPTDLGAGYADAVIHHSSTNGLQIHANEGVAARPDGRVTVALQDLSIVDSVKTAARWVSGIGVGAVALAGQAEQVWRAALGVGGPPVTCSPNLTGQALPGSELFSVSGQMLSNRPLTPPLTHCVTRSHGDEGVPDGRFGVNRGIINVLDGRSGVAVHDVSRSGSLMWFILGGLWNDRAVVTGQPLYMAPGTTFSAHPTMYQGSFHVETDLLDYLLVTAGYWLFDELSFGLPPAIVNIFRDHPNCMYQVATALGAAVNGQDAALRAAFTVVTDLFECSAKAIEAFGNDEPVEVLKWFVPDPTVGQAQDAYVFLERLKRALKMLQAAKYATVVADAGSTRGLNGTVEMSWRPDEPATPASDAKRRNVFERCVSKRFSYDSGWTVTIDAICQDLAHGQTPNAGPPPPIGPAVDAFDDWVGEITSLRMYNVLRRDAAGVLHLILLEGGALVAHPIAAGDEWSFKEDWPEDEWRSLEFDDLIDRVGSAAVNDPLRLRNFTEGRGHSWLLRQADGTAWWIDGEGIRRPLPTLQSQEAISNTVLTLHPAQYAHDICPYPQQGETGLRVC